MKTFLTLMAAFLVNLAALSQSGPQLEFINPVLVSGVANQQGAVYRFSNITTGVDAEIKVKKVSRNDIVIANIDNSTLGWNKAFQPEFGLPGLVAPQQNWYIDFELSFFNAGTYQKRVIDTIDLTALDVDGDGRSISEYVTYDNPNSILYSTFTYLTAAATGVLGQTFECDIDGTWSTLVICSHCNGTGLTNSGSGNNNECPDCEGSGKLYENCGHPYEAGTGNTVNGPVNNFVDIDTSATQVMATYQFLNKDKIKFRYGAKSGALSSNGSGVRLNSTWFRRFSLKPYTTLPVKLETFTAILNNNKKVDLKWVTATEINTSHFIIEKSIDGKNFFDAGKVLAGGYAKDKSNYNFSDNLAEAQKGVIYYRLRSVDIDGKSEYSATRIIRLSDESKNKVILQTYPNPVANEVRITIPSHWQGKKVIYELINGNAQTLRRVEVGSGSQTESLNINDLARGFYIVVVTCDGEIAQQKVVKN